MHKLLTILLFAYGLAITTDDIYDNSYALIMGIDKYKNVSNLSYKAKFLSYPIPAAIVEEWEKVK